MKILKRILGIILMILWILMSLILIGSVIGWLLFTEPNWIEIGQKIQEKLLR